jgi:hypothetical protein
MKYAAKEVGRPTFQKGKSSSRYFSRPLKIQDA